MLAMGLKMVAPGPNFGGTGEVQFKGLNWFKCAALKLGPVGNLGH